MESLYLTASALSGTLVLLSLLHHISLYNSNNILPLSPYLSTWTPLLILIPIFLLAKNKYYWLHKSRLHNARLGTIYPHRDPFLGTDWLRSASRALAADNFLEECHDLFHSVGQTFWAQSVGYWTVMTNDPENVHAILGASSFNDFEIGGPRKMSTTLTLGPHAIFSVNGKEWEEGRRLIRPCFVRNQVADLHCQDRHVERLLERIIMAQHGGGGDVELQELLYMFTMDSATDFILGYSTDTLVSPSEEKLRFTEAYDRALLKAATHARLGWITRMIPDGKFDEDVRVIREFVDGYVESAAGENAADDGDDRKGRPYILLTELIASGVSKEHMRDQLLAIIIGGRDTTAGTLSSLFWILARRPEVVEKLRTEVSVLDGRKPTWEDLKGFKYLNMVLKETLRLWPPVSTNMRVAVKDTTLPRGGGPDGQSPLFIPKGTDIRWSVHSLHRREDYYGEDAEEFIPERWETLRPSWEFIPFHGGPRICIGQQFAMTQMSYVVARFFQIFEGVEPRDDRPRLTRVSTTTSLVNGCLVRFKLADGKKN